MAKFRSASEEVMAEAAAEDADFARAWKILSRSSEPGHAGWAGIAYTND